MPMTATWVTHSRGLARRCSVVVVVIVVSICGHLQVTEQIGLTDFTDQRDLVGARPIVDAAHMLALPD